MLGGFAVYDLDVWGFGSCLLGTRVLCSGVEASVYYFGGSVFRVLVLACFVGLGLWVLGFGVGRVLWLRGPGFSDFGTSGILVCNVGNLEEPVWEFRSHFGSSLGAQAHRSSCSPRGGGGAAPMALAAFATAARWVVQAARQAAPEVLQLPQSCRQAARRLLALGTRRSTIRRVGGLAPTAGGGCVLGLRWAVC